jgi:hypothetical protein
MKNVYVLIPFMDFEVPYLDTNKIERLKEYKAKGYHIVFNCKSNKFDPLKKLAKGSAVIVDFEIDNNTLYKPMINIIDTILYRNDNGKRRFYSKKYKKWIITPSSDKHNITIKYSGLPKEQSRVCTMTDWKYSYTSEKDVNRISSYKHPILKDYYNHVSEYFEKKTKDCRSDYYNRLTLELKIVPTESEIQTMLDKYARFYGISVSQEDNIGRLRDYMQIKFYIEHNIEPDYLPDEDVELSIGDATMLDDFIYKYRLQAED